MAASKRRRVLYMRYRYTPETARAHNRLYSPGGCGCALLMAPVVALGAVVTIAAMGVAVASVAGIFTAVGISIWLAREYRHKKICHPIAAGLTAALALTCIAYLALFARFIA